MINDIPAIHASVGLNPESSMRFRVCDDGESVEFVAGRDGTEFDIAFETETLRRFVELASTALSEADALLATTKEKAT